MVQDQNNTETTKQTIAANIAQIKDLIDSIENKDDDRVEQYNDFLDEVGTVKIGGLTYSASRVLEEVDPTAYSFGYDDYFDDELSELHSEREKLQEALKELEGGQ